MSGYAIYLCIHPFRCDLKQLDSEKQHVKCQQIFYYPLNYDFCVFFVSLASNNIGHHGAASLAEVLPQCAQIQQLEYVCGRGTRGMGLCILGTL